MFKRSTRSIVAGKRHKDAKTEQSPDTAETDASGIDGTEAPQSPQAPPLMPFMTKLRRLKLPWWAFWIIGALVSIGVLALILIVISSKSVQPSGTPTLPKIEEGKTIISVQADTALTSLACPGDIVQLYSADGPAIEALQYLQVYKPADDGRLLLLVDKKQASAIISQEISNTVVLVCHKDSDRADALLDLQQRINHPQIRLELPSTLLVEPGNHIEIPFKAEINPVQATLPEVEWSSDAPDIVSVNNGILHANAVGEAAITARCGEVEATCLITVEVPLASIQVIPELPMIAVGESLKLEATPYPLSATRYDPTWSISDTSIATISEDGTITGLMPGTAIVTVSSGDIVTKRLITVGYHAEIVQLDLQSISLAIGQRHKLEPTTYPSTHIIDTIEYISSNTKVVTVADDGTITAVSPGTAIIYLHCGKITVKCTVTVTQ